MCITSSGESAQRRMSCCRATAPVRRLGNSQMDASGTGGPSPPRQRSRESVRAVLDEISGLAAKCQRRDVLERCQLEAARLDAAEPVTVVVAAETSRGKSTLVNALIGRP